MTSREDVLQVKDDFKAMTSYASTSDNGREDVGACALTTEYNFGSRLKSVQWAAAMSEEIGVYFYVTVETLVASGLRRKMNVALGKRIIYAD